MAGWSSGTPTRRKQGHRSQGRTTDFSLHHLSPEEASALTTHRKKSDDPAIAPGDTHGNRSDDSSEGGGSLFPLSSPPTSEEISSSYEGLARRYRPQTFDDVVGQQHVVRTLSRSLDANQWAGAYLFVGGRGLGKTTMARLLAKGVNCESGPTSHPCGHCSACREIAASRDIDVLEIDAASHTGVDNVRDLIIQAVSTSPVRGRAKIFIIDEVHMLSTAAFNALLKTIEEPPPGIVFILATTDGHKVPATIRSRCRRFDFRPVSIEELSERLTKIADAERFTIDDEALRLLSEYAEGGVRDALSALDLVRSYSGDAVTLADAENALGVIPSRAIAEMMAPLERGDAGSAVARMEEILKGGADAQELLRGLLLAYRRRLHEELATKAASSRGRVVRSIDALLSAADRARYTRFPRLELETLLCRLAHFTEDEITLKDLYQRLAALETGNQSAAMAPSDVALVKPAPSVPATSVTQESKPSAPAVPGRTTPKVEIPKTEVPQSESPKDDVVEMLQRIFNAEVVDVVKKS